MLEIACFISVAEDVSITSVSNKGSVQNLFGMTVCDCM